MRTASPRLRRFARPKEGNSVLEAPEEQCELCGEPLPPEHRHLLDLESRRLLCACRACTILFDRSGAGGRHYRLVPDRTRFVTDLRLDDVTWQALAIPVELAFFFHSSAAGKVAAFYPSPLGATESLLDLATWTEIADANPVLRELEPDVEALLVDRTRDGEHWLLPVDRCYELVGLVRTRWRGFRGGDELWSSLDDFYASLRARAKPVTRDGKEATWEESRSASPT